MEHHIPGSSVPEGYSYSNSPLARELKELRDSTLTIKQSREIDQEMFESLYTMKSYCEARPTCKRCELGVFCAGIANDLLPGCKDLSVLDICKAGPKDKPRYFAFESE